MTHKKSLPSTERPELAGELPPESKLLLYCARPSADEATANQIRALLETKLDWPRIHRVAYCNGQLPTLASRLRQCGAELVPPDTLEMLTQFAAGHAIQNQKYFEALRQWNERFAAAEIEALPFVESCFLLSAYAGFGPRPSHWIDFLIRPEGLEPARKLLQSTDGWNEYPPEEDPRSSWQQGGWSRWSGPGEIVLVLQWACALRVRAIRLDVQEVFVRKTSFSFRGHLLPTMAAEDALLHACVRNYGDPWTTLTNVCDLARMVHSQPDLQWRALTEMARDTGTRRMLLLGLRLAEGLLGTALPNEILHEIERDGRVETLAKEIADNLLRTVPDSSRTPDLLRFHLRVRERTTDRLRYLWRYLTTPTQVEQRLLKLPARLAFLYAWFRPWRLAGSTLAFFLRRPLQKLFPRPQSVSGYSPSKMAVVQRMLELAEVGPGDTVYDLGCGDGRIVIHAAKAFGARGVGIDLDPQRIRESQENARQAGVEDKVEFLLHDAMKADLSRATVVTLYLPPAGSLQVGQRLMRELAPGSRVVSHNIALGEWDRAETCVAEKDPALIYLYRVKKERAPICS